MKDYRRLTEDEILQLKSQSCLADDWGDRKSTRLNSSHIL